MGGRQPPKLLLKSPSETQMKRVQIGIKHSTHSFCHSGKSICLWLAGCPGRRQASGCGHRRYLASDAARPSRRHPVRLVTLALAMLIPSLQCCWQALTNQLPSLATSARRQVANNTRRGKSHRPRPPVTPSSRREDYSRRISTLLKGSEQECSKSRASEQRNDKANECKKREHTQRGKVKMRLGSQVGGQSQRREPRGWNGTSTRASSKAKKCKGCPDSSIVKADPCRNQISS